MSANMSINTGKYCWCLKTNKNRSETEKLSSPFTGPVWTGCQIPACSSSPWESDPSLFSPSLSEVGAQTPCLSSMIPSLPPPEMQVSARGTTGGPFSFPGTWVISTSTLLWSLLDVNPAVLYRMFFIPTCKSFFPPSCYYDYPLGWIKNCFLFVHWGNMPFPAV